jgi:pyrroline-5-carboxylate reductase
MSTTNDAAGGTMTGGDMAASPTVAIVGAGNLGGAVAAGLLAADAVDRSRLRCVTASEASAQRLRGVLGEGVMVSTDAAAAVQGADVVMVGVKPPKVTALVRELSAHLVPGVTLVSLAAGVDVAEVVAVAPAGAQVVRVMTNTPVRIRAATSLVCAPDDVDPAALARVVALTDALGTTHVLEESLLDAATALAGSGPAYLFLLVECLRDAGVALGLEVDAAQAMAVTAMDGAARLLLASGEDPAALRAAVTSPGGMTAQAVRVFEEAGLRATTVEALAAAVARARELQRPAG